MSFYFRAKPKIGDRLRGKSGDELLQEIKQQFDEDSKSFFEPTGRTGRDPFERHTMFPRGFPFDDESFGRSSDIRGHLDDLAARHPEFADHLLGPPWGDISFHGSFRNRNRGPGNAGGNGNYQGYSDEDARSQASGSSAASGASAVSSHGDTEGNQGQQDRGSQSSEQATRRSQIPQYGLRNTVDIGQHHHNMENLDRGNRGQRSMSAPPENRQSSSQPQPQQQQQPQGQRYISRIDITPQHNQPPQPQKPQPQQQQQQQKPQQQPQQQQGNVRHIPIFVEGRDEPVLPRSYDEPHFRREPSPTQFHTPPHFQRSSPFGQSPFGRTHQWSPHFQDPFYPPSSTFEHPSRRQQQYTERQPRQQQYTERQPQQQYTDRQPQQHYEQPRQQQKPQQPQPPQQPQQQEPPSKSKPALPKDPLERVALVQKEVDALAEQVKQYSGNSRTDKEYIYLDEMLTRELIKLDDIETEGRENVRQARRNAIKCIQATISLLESMAPLPSQPTSPEEAEKQGNEASSSVQVTGQSESMDVDQKTEEQTQHKEPIPLPPGPSSPTMKSEEANEASAENTKNPANDKSANQQQEAGQPSSEPMDTTPAEKTEATPMEVQQSPEQADVTEEKKVENVSEEKKAEGAPEEMKQENVSEEKKPDNASVEEAGGKKEEKKNPEDASKENKSENVPDEGKKPESKQPSEEQQKPVEEKMEVDGEVKKSPKTPKKAKKSKKQVPVSDKPIPLPPPEGTEASAK